MAAMQQYPQSGPPAQQQPANVVPRSAGLALVLGLFFPGVGNMYAGRPGKGILILACTIIAWASVIVLVGLVLAPTCHVWGAWTATKDARRWNAARGLIS